jgi:hypothetical protein
VVSACLFLLLSSVPCNMPQPLHTWFCHDSGHSQQRPGFDLRPVPVGFVVYKVTLLQVLEFSLSECFHTHLLMSVTLCDTAAGSTIISVSCNTSSPPSSSALQRWVLLGPPPFHVIRHY